MLVQFPALVKLADNRMMEGSQVPKQEEGGEHKTQQEVTETGQHDLDRRLDGQINPEVVDGMRPERFTPTGHEVCGLVQKKQKKKHDKVNETKRIKQTNTGRKL